jgi:hypothetical protein
VDRSEIFLIKVIFTFMCVMFSFFNTLYKNQINSFYSIEQRKSFDKRCVRAEKAVGSRVTVSARVPEVLGQSVSVNEKKSLAVSDRQ